MVTAGLRSDVRRPRAQAGPLWACGLALLLLGLLYTHGGGAGDTARHHGGPVAAQPATDRAGAAATTAHAPPGDRDGHGAQPGAAHQALECLAGQPQEGFVPHDPGAAPAPCPYPDVPTADGPVTTGTGKDAPRGRETPGAPGTSTVLRI